MTPLHGRTWRFGDDVDTDVIHPPPFFSLDPERVKVGLFHGLDPTLQPRLRPGDLFVAGRNFGCGSSRETSVRSLRLNQVGAVIAVSFARIFFRNATNNGLPCLVFEDPADLARIGESEVAALDPSEGRLEGPWGSIRLQRPAPFVARIWAAGGLLNLLEPADPGLGTSGP